jgi:hypothetical protein
MYAHPGSVLLLDEPDAHLEILRQRQIYQLLSDVALVNGNQIIAASHSEVLLNEAAEQDIVVAFVGKPHRINDQGSQLLKSLRDIGFEDYYQAEQTGWVLYLGNPTDLAILRAFAEVLENQEAIEVLKRPFIHYTNNQTSKVKRHFFGLKEAVPNIIGIAVFNKLNHPISENLGAEALSWEKRGIENYICHTEILEAYAMTTGKENLPGPLFEAAHAESRKKLMQEAIAEQTDILKAHGLGSPWEKDTAVSDDFLIPLFRKFFGKLSYPSVMDKRNFHELARFVQKEKIDEDVKGKLDAIVSLSKRARPRYK